MNYRRIATFTGWLWIITFVTSIPARFFFYAPVLDHEGNYVTGAGTDAQTLFAGIANGLILGWLMYRSGLVPPRFALFGLVGGPLVSIVGVLVILGVLPAEGPHQVLVAPEFIWELGIGIYLIVKGYRTSSPALAGTQEAPPV